MAINMKEEDFPLYQLLLKNKEPGIEKAIEDFKAAARGGDEEQYRFALGIQTIATITPASEISGLSEDIRQKTLHSCLAIFESIAKGRSTEAQNAKFMVNYFKKSGLGL